MGVDLDREPEIAWQIAADLMPRPDRIVAAQDVSMFLHEQNVRMSRMHCNAMHTMPYIGVGIRQLIFRVDTLVDGTPCPPPVVGPERAGGRDGDVEALRIVPIQDDRMQAHSAGARLPEIAFNVAEACDLLPRLPAVR